MYTNTQIFPLLALVAHIASQASDEGCDGDLTVTSKSAVEQAGVLAQALQRSPLQLAIGVHSHKHGDSLYAFGVQEGQVFGEGDFAAHLDDQFEPDREEFANLHSFPEKEIVLITGEPVNGQVVNFEPLEDLIDAAKQHGEDSEPDHEVGDLQDLLRAMWELLTPEQRLSYVGLSKVVQVKLNATGEF